MGVRIAAGQPRQVTVQFPEAATNVQVTTASARNGTVSGPVPATNVGGGVWGHTLTYADVQDPDKLTLTFTGEVGGNPYQVRSDVDVAGSHYFTLEEARSIGGISSSISDAEIESVRCSVEDQIEANCDTSFVSRLVVEELSPNPGEPFVRLTEAYVLRVVSVEDHGVDITDEVVADGRYLWREPRGWSPGLRSVRVVYEAGWSETPPEDLRRAAINAARYRLLEEARVGTPSNVITIGTDVGTVRMAVASLKAPFGVPEVDAVVLRWAQKVGVDW